jgi:tetratricopeptide (TPR) repeat protein
MTGRPDPYDQALALSRAGRTAEALKAAETALARDGRNVAALALKAALHLQLGDPAAALGACDQALAVQPGYARAHRNRGDALQALGRADEALAAYDKALQLQPDDLAAHVNRGNLLSEQKRWAEALASYEGAIALDPKVPQAHVNRARVLCELERYAEGLEAAEQAVALQPGYAKAWSRRGDALLGLERFEDALESFGQAARRQRTDYVLIGASHALKALGRYDEAIRLLDEAEALDPAAPLAPYHRSMVRLLTGDFARGWRDYEARWRLASFVDSSNGFATAPLRERLTLFPSAMDLKAGRLLVVGEQGVGDQLMHASMLPDLLAGGADVTWICDRRLHRLLGRSFPTVKFLDLRDAPLPDPGGFDRIVASGSLGHAFRRSLAVVQAWAERLGPKRARLRIGVSWRGGLLRTGRSRRSMKLADMGALLTRPDCEFVSLQYGDVQAEVAEAAGELGVDVRAFPPAEIDDFEDLAALVANLDLVVSVQTALVHLTGATGREALVMVPRRPEWRYGASGSSMPWYRSVRLFRQDRSEGWAPVVAAIGEVIAERAKQA